MSFFVALSIWLVLDKPMPYFDMMKNSFQYIFLTLIIPYSILALSVRVYDYSNKSAGTDDAARRMRFYDSSHNLKFVINPESVLYIGAEENYIRIYYSDGSKIKSYVLRNSMKAVDELCLSNGLVRCHRSYYVNPSHIKVLRKDREGVVFAILDVDDVIETSNHFRCIDMVIDQAGSALTEKFIKELHFVLKTGTSDSRKDWFAVGDYKKLPNEVGGNDTTLPEDVAGEIRKLLSDYNALPSKTFEDIVAFHVAGVLLTSPAMLST